RHLVVLTCYLSDDLPTPQICTPSLHDALPICRCEAPIIVVSANAFADDRERSVAARFNDFLAKPVHIPMLLEKIRQHLQVTWIKRPAAPAALPASLIQPSARSLRELKALSALGHVRGLLERLERIDHEEPASQAFTAQLRQLVKGFQLHELNRRLNEVDHD